MKKKLIWGTLILVAIGLIYWLVAPLFITKKSNETLQDIVQEEMAENAQEQEGVQEENIETIATGTFVGIAGHAGSGQASLLTIGDSYYVRFEENFQTTNGPDLFVHLGKDGEYAPEARLGNLKGNIGGQNYKIPDSIDISQYNEVWVWCRAFSVPFAKATFVTP